MGKAPPFPFLCLLEGEEGRQGLRSFLSGIGMGEGKSSSVRTVSASYCKSMIRIGFLGYFPVDVIWGLCNVWVIELLRRSRPHGTLQYLLLNCPYRTVQNLPRQLSAGF